MAATDCASLNSIETKAAHDDGNHRVLRIQRNLLTLRKKASNTLRANHISYTIENWDMNIVEAELKRRGLKPEPQEGSVGFIALCLRTGRTREERALSFSIDCTLARSHRRTTRPAPTWGSAQGIPLLAGERSHQAKFSDP